MLGVVNETGQKAGRKLIAALVSIRDLTRTVVANKIPTSSIRNVWSGLLELSHDLNFIQGSERLRGVLSIILKRGDEAEDIIVLLARYSGGLKNDARAMPKIAEGLKDIDKSGDTLAVLGRIASPGERNILFAEEKLTEITKGIGKLADHVEHGAENARLLVGKKNLQGVHSYTQKDLEVLFENYAKFVDDTNRSGVARNMDHLVSRYRAGYIYEVEVAGSRGHLVRDMDVPYPPHLGSGDFDVVTELEVLQAKHLLSGNPEPAKRIEFINQLVENRAAARDPLAYPNKTWKAVFNLEPKDDFLTMLTDNNIVWEVVTSGR